MVREQPIDGEATESPERDGVRSHRDLLVWQKALDLVDEMYRVAKSLPAEETYGLRSQITRAAVSVPTNIAEGAARSTSKDFANFLSYARGSLMEIDTLLAVMIRQGYATEVETSTAFTLIGEIGKMLSGLRSSVLRRGRR